MSRFIKYASNLLDGVDNIAKDSLTDQDIAAAAAERRRRRRQLKKGTSSQRGGGGGGGGDAAEPSEGDLSGDSSQLDTPGAGGARNRRASSGVGSTSSGLYGRDSTRLPYGGGSFDEGGSAAEEGHTGQQGPPWSSAESPATSSLATGTPAAFSPGPSSMVAAAADATTPTSKPDAAAVAGERGAGFAAATAGYPSSAGEEDEVAAAAAPVVASSTTLRQPRPNTPQHRYLRETPGVAAGGGGAPGKEDGSVWSDKDTISSVAPSPLGRGHALHGDHHAHGSDGLEGTTTPSRLLRSPSLESSLIGGTAGVVVGDGGGEGDEGEEEEREKQERRTRAASITASNVSMHTNASLSPATTPLGGQQQRRRQQQDQPEGVYDGGGGPGHGAGSSAAGFSLAAPSPPGAASSSTAGAGSGSAADGRERRGFSSLLGMGGNKERERRGRGSNHDGADDGGEVEVLRAEAEELRAEVEELSLELEDAEDRLRGQEAELRSGAEKLMRQKAAAVERERTIEAEMEEFRTLQLEEKKVFLANLEGMERSLKEKEKDSAEARSALSAIEAFAMEREDAVTKLAHEKEELLEELKGARSGQDRSAEEVREALTKAEAEAEEVETRHRAWMRQAQARQTELEATAAQLAEALAEAKREQQQQQSALGEDAVGEGARRGEGQGGRARTADRELRALGDELDSCQASLELEQERTRSLQQEMAALKHDLDAARATEAVTERQRQEHAKMAADSFAKASRLEQQLEQEKASAKRLGASVPPPAGPESQIQALSSKLLDKQARLEESQRARTTLSAKLKEASDRAFRAEQELRESRGESLEGGVGEGGGGGGMMRSRRGRQDRSSLGRSSPTGAWSRIGPIAKHKKIATAVDVLDRQTLQGVVFLRNSSVARATFLAYLLLLHFWAFAILSFHSSNHAPDMRHPAEYSGNVNHGH